MSVCVCIKVTGPRTGESQWHVYQEPSLLPRRPVSCLRGFPFTLSTLLENFWNSQHLSIIIISATFWAISWQNYCLSHQPGLTWTCVWGPVSLQTFQPQLSGSWTANGRWRRRSVMRSLLYMIINDWRKMDDTSPLHRGTLINSDTGEVNISGFHIIKSQTKTKPGLKSLFISRFGLKNNTTWMRQCDVTEETSNGYKIHK